MTTDEVDGHVERILREHGERVRKRQRAWEGEMSKGDGRERAQVWWIIAAAVGFLVLSLLIAKAGWAEQVCQSVYNAMENRWEYQCVDRPDRGYQAPPVCHQEYDAMNQVWVTVCN